MLITPWALHTQLCSGRSRPVTSSFSLTFCPFSTLVSYSTLEKLMRHMVPCCGTVVLNPGLMAFKRDGHFNRPAFICVGSFIERSLYLNSCAQTRCIPAYYSLALVT